MIKLAVVWFLAVQYVGSNNKESHAFVTTHISEQECMIAQKKVQTGFYGNAICYKGVIGVNK